MRLSQNYGYHAAQHLSSHWRSKLPFNRSETLRTHERLQMAIMYPVSGGYYTLVDRFVDVSQLALHGSSVCP